MAATQAELRHQVVRLKGTPKRLERGVVRVRRYIHPGRLIGTVGPEVLMRIDDETHRMPPRVRNALYRLSVPKIRLLLVMETAPRAPRSRRAAEQRDELAALQMSRPMFEHRPLPALLVAAYRILSLPPSAPWGRPELF